jgi:hypothetical protein
MKSKLFSVFAFSGSLALATLCAHSAVIDDFNVNEGRFTSIPETASGTSKVGPASTADRVTTDGPFEGAGHQRIYLTNRVGEATFRLRHLSGGGSMGNNFPIPTTDGVDGRVGFYLKMPVSNETNWTVSLTLDGAPGALADMDGGVRKAVIPDGQWHLYEWDLDAAEWGPAQAIGGGHADSMLLNTNHTIDNIFFNYTNTTVFPAEALFFLDFVAWNPSGSVSNLFDDPCTKTGNLVMDEGPVSTLSTQVLVKGVSDTATEIKIYQDAGSGWVQVGSKTTGITAGNNQVSVAGLVKGAEVGATQVVSGQEGCSPSSTIFVGSGANPPVRIALSITEASHVTPTGIGAPVPGTNMIHFLGATASGARDAQVFYPSNDWQTVTFERVFEGVGDVTGVQRDILPPAGGNNYTADTSVTARVYAFRTVNGVRAFSTNFEEVSAMSNGVYVVNWSWNVVPEAEGYRIVREYAPWGSGFLHFVDVTGANSFLDENSLWDFVVPEEMDVKGFQTTPSWAWNVGFATNNLPGTWGALDAIVFSVNGDSGPYDIYIDNLMNGSTLIHGYEEAPAGMTGFGFQHPGYSGTTSGSLLVGSSGGVSNLAADTGTKSQRLRWQFSSVNPGTWLRFTPYAAIQPVGNTGVTRPAIRLDQPISFRMLMQPVGATPPAAPPAPLLSVEQVGNDVVLDWDGAHRLQTATNLAGPFQNAAQTMLMPNTNTFLAPWTNSTTGSARFFRLVD